MYTATITRTYRHDVIIGPTDTRDEASRLARAWMENAGEAELRGVGSVLIVRVPDDDDE